MSFNKALAKAASKTGHEQRSNIPKSYRGFVPSTPKELREYARGGRRHREEHMAAKGARNERGGKHGKRKDKLPRGSAAVEAALARLEPVRVYRPQLFDMFLKFCKDVEEKPPAYCEYLKPKEADPKFMFEIRRCLSRMGWTRLGYLLDAGLNATIPTRDASSAFHHAAHMMECAFGARDDSRMEPMIHNRDALEEWPVASRKRKGRSTTDEEEPDMFTDENNRKLRAMAGDDDDDEDEDEGTRSGRDEDEDEDEDEDGDEEDEAPRRSRAKKTAKKKTAEKKPAKKTSRRRSRDEYEDEDEAPRRSRRSARRGNGSDKKPSDVPTKIAPSAIVRHTSKKRSGGGPKGTLYGLVTKKGVKYKDLLAAAEDEELNLSKVKKWVPMMAKNGYLEIEQ